jgi:hypothetical protein
LVHNGVLDIITLCLQKMLGPHDLRNFVLLALQSKSRMRCKSKSDRADDNMAVLQRLLLNARSLSANGLFDVLPSLSMSTGFSFAHYHHRFQDFCSLHGFRLALEVRQCTQPRPCTQNLASLGPGMVASGSGLTCHVIPCEVSLYIVWLLRVIAIIPFFLKC